MSLPITSRFSRARYRHLKRLMRRLRNRNASQPRLLVLAALAGVLTGGICSGFEWGLNGLMHWRGDSLASLPTGLAWLLAALSGALMAGAAMYLTHRFAPEAGGSGIPEIEGALEGLRPTRWGRVLPVKFIGGLLALGSGMILGREGPSVQIGGNLGAMVSDLSRLRDNGRHMLLAAGAAAGLTAAFNAPLAAILFVLEELRSQFKYSFVAVKCVSVAVIASTLCRHAMMGDAVAFSVPRLAPPGGMYWIGYLLLGMLAGVAGVGFNRLVGWGQDTYLQTHAGRRWVLVGMLAIVGALFGVLSLTAEGWAGGGMPQIPHWVTEAPGFWLLMALLLWRTFGSLLCFCSGIPGGIFAPVLSLGTLLGALYGVVWQGVCPGPDDLLASSALVGMCALFAASVRAPITGILLVAEMSNNFGLILPMMLATLGATLVAQMLGGQPLYTQILTRTLRLAGAARTA